jgi:hypothetical protein
MTIQLNGRSLLWGLVALGAVAGGIILGAGVRYANSAIQEAASCAYALAVCILPYVFARANDELNRDGMLAEFVVRMGRIEKLLAEQVRESDDEDYDDEDYDDETQT